MSHQQEQTHHKNPSLMCLTEFGAIFFSCVVALQFDCLFAEAHEEPMCALEPTIVQKLVHFGYIYTQHTSLMKMFTIPSAYKYAEKDEVTKQLQYDLVLSLLSLNGKWGSHLLHHSSITTTISFEDWSVFGKCFLCHGPVYLRARFLNSKAPAYLIIRRSIHDQGHDFRISGQNPLSHQANVKTGPLCTAVILRSSIIIIHHPYPNQGHDFRRSGQTLHSHQPNVNTGPLYCRHNCIICLRDSASANFGIIHHPHPSSIIPIRLTIYKSQAKNYFHTTTTIQTGPLYIVTDTTVQVVVGIQHLQHWDHPSSKPQSGSQFYMLRPKPTFTPKQTSKKVHFTLVQTQPNKSFWGFSNSDVGIIHRHHPFNVPLPPKSGCVPLGAFIESPVQLTLWSPASLTPETESTTGRKSGRGRLLT